jgi:hypothetical protein
VIANQGSAGDQVLSERCCPRLGSRPPVGAYLSVSRSTRVNRTGAPMPGLGQTPWAGISGAGVSVEERLMGGGYYQPTGVRKPSAECRAGQRGRCATRAWLGI